MKGIVECVFFSGDESSKISARGEKKDIKLVCVLTWPMSFKEKAGRLKAEHGGASDQNETSCETLGIERGARGPWQ